MANILKQGQNNIDAYPYVLTNTCDVHGAVTVIKVTYAASALGSGTDITVARLPHGARVLVIHVKAHALGSNVTLAVADSADTDRYITAQAMNTGNKLISLSSDGVIGSVGYEIGDVTDITILTAGATASGTITSVVYYTVS